MKSLYYLLLISIFLFSCKEVKNEIKNSQTETKIVSREMKEIILSGGKIERIDSFPSKFVKPRNVDIWLPENYSKEKKYAVLYMHDGQNLFDATKTWNQQEWRVDEIVSELIDIDTIKATIVVAIWNVGEIRHQDYFPQKALDFLSPSDKEAVIENSKSHDINMNPADLNADNYLKFIVEELKPFVDREYSTLTDYENTMISGSSMGALISMYAVCEYPEVFGGAACISTHWPGVMPTKTNPIPEAIFKYMETNLPSPETHKFYFDYGTQTLDKFYPQYLDDVDRIFTKKGFTVTNYMNLEFEGADHSEDSWNRRFDIPLTFLLNK